jgi:hypothetical protein
MDRGVVRLRPDLYDAIADPLRLLAAARAEPSGDCSSRLDGQSWRRSQLMSARP